MDRKKEIQQEEKKTKDTLRDLIKTTESK